MRAIELMKKGQGKCRNETLVQFAGHLLPAIESNKKILKDLARQIGGGLSTINDAIGWADEKFCHLKLREGKSWWLGTRNYFTRHCPAGYVFSLFLLPENR